MTKVPSKTVQKAEVVTIGKKEVISTGLWNDDFMADYVLEHGQKKWLPMKELARFAYHSGTPQNQTKVRQRLHKLFKAVLRRGSLLAIEYGDPHNSAQSVKIFDPTSLLDQQHVKVKMERMLGRLKLSESQYEQAVAILERDALPPSGETVAAGAPA
jgi:hypothetical protein